MDCYYIVCDISNFILTPKWMTVCVWHCLWWCKLMFVTRSDRRYYRSDVVGSCVEAMSFSSRSWFWIAIYNVRYNDTRWYFADDIILSILTDVHWLLITGLYVSAMISFRNVLYHTYFRCFVRRCSRMLAWGCFRVMNRMLSIVYVIAYWPVSLSFA